MHVLAIDQGTSSTKALVIGPEGVVLGEGVAAVASRPGAAGEITQDPAELLDSILQAGRAAVTAAGTAPDAVGIGNQGETVLQWDLRTGRALGPAISWQDRRAAAVMAGLADRAERLQELTGLPLDPYFAAPKMAWLQRELGQGGVITTVDAWLTHRLTGAFVSDVATASRTMLLDLERGVWSPEACEIFGLDPDRQPQIVGNAEIVGETEAFGPAVPVSGLVVDQQAALLAERCLEFGAAKCTYGTGAFVLANAGPTRPADRTLLATSVAWRLGGDTTYCLDGQIYTAGAALAWLAEVGLLDDLRLLDADTGDNPAGPDAPVFVPAQAGLGAPHWEPRAKGGWVGLSLATSAADLRQAVLWGIAAQVALLVGAMRESLSAPIDALRVDGGLTRSRRLLQAQADLLQMPVERHADLNATAAGIAALARIGAGAAATPAEALGEPQRVEIFEPHLSPAEAVDRLARHDAAARALIGLR